MRIFIYISDFGPGGAERVCVNLANELVNRSHEVHIITLNLNQDVYSKLLDWRIEVHSLQASRIRYAIFPILGLIRKKKVEKILIFGNEMGIILSKFRHFKLIKSKLVVRVLNNTEIKIDKEEQASQLVQNVLKKSFKDLEQVDYVITQCHAMEQMIKGQLNLEGKCKCIYNPVSKYLVENADAVKRTRAEHRKIGFIGRLVPQKNINDLLQAFALLCKQEHDVSLHIYGQGILKEKAIEIVNELKIGDKVFFEGVRDDMERVYGDLDMVVLSSNYEGMPNALIEAVSIGIPVVSYDCPIGPAEIIEDGVNGYLIPMYDIEGLAAGMSKCLSREWDSKLIKESARKFKVEDIAKEYEQILLEV